MITKDELLADRDKTFADEYTEDISDNLDRGLPLLNQIRAAYGKPMICTSGWRPKAVNKMIANAAPDSAHQTGEAADFRDKDGQLRDWCLANLDFLKKLKIHVEDFRYTKGWVHFSWRAPSSKKRIFIPSKGLPPNPEWWPSPKYDSKHDG